MIVGYARVSNPGPGSDRPARRPQGRRCRKGLAREGLGGQDRPARTRQAHAIAAARRRAAGHSASTGSPEGTRDLLNVLDAVTKAGAAFKSLSDQWADTTTPHGRLMLTVLRRLGRVRESADQSPNRGGP